MHTYYQNLGSGMRSHMDTCWPLDAPQLAGGTVHAQSHILQRLCEQHKLIQAVPTYSNYVPTEELRATNLWQKAAT